MHYLLTPVGTAGDVHPYIGIGRELRRRGHDVTLLTGEPFRAVAERGRLDFVSGWSEEQYYAATQHPDLWHPTRGMRLVLSAVGTMLRQTYATLSQLYQPGRTVLVGHTLSFATRTFEEKSGAPAATIHIAPVAFRSVYLGPAVGRGRDISGAPRWFKRALWWLADRLMIDPMIAPTLNAWRAELDLPPVRRVFNDWLHSPRRTIGIFPEWFAPPQPDWPPQLRLTGFPLFDEADDRPLDADLEDFLAGGEPPIVFTPGTGNRQAPAFFTAAVGAATSLGRRALLLTQFPEQLPDDLPAGVRHVSYAPFSGILDRCAALVHHGGVGTCAQGLAAGIPQLTMPMGFDQPDNALRLYRLGVGSWLTPRKFTAKRVAEALGALLDSRETAEVCLRCRERVRALDAVAQTCDLLEQLA
ncbi:MAG: glycosyltransferase family 1 protein [Gemmatimonadota bacterium]|nr:MAG: glycosyltransferase family 1 protein [Gemmatimonadota bacterium]